VASDIAAGGAAGSLIRLQSAAAAAAPLSARRSATRRSTRARATMPSTASGETPRRGGRPGFHTRGSPPAGARRLHAPRE
jgi:hypothetical protein